MVKWMIRNHNAVSVLWVALLAMVWTGCAGLGRSLQAPDVQLAGLLVEEVDFFETVLRLKLRVINGNDIPLAIKGIQCELELDDNSVATGVTNAPVNIPALASETVSVTVYSSMVDIASSFFRMARKGAHKTKSPEFTYRLRGRIHIETSGLTPSTIPFKTTGKISFEDTLRKMVE